MTNVEGTNARGTPRVLRWLLGGQIALAVLLIGLDLAPTIPSLMSPSDAPSLDQPTRPGDQTRQYQPRRTTAPLPGVSNDMPRRLLTELKQVDDASILELRGAITVGDGARITAELRETRPTLVTFDSPGGSVADALLIGKTLRALETETRIEGNAVCLSACPYMFVGGLDRSIEDGGRLGIHQHSFGESTLLPAFLAVEDIQKGQASVLTHLDDMGIDLRMMGPAMATPADEIYLLTSEELSDWNVVTE